MSTTPSPPRKILETSSFELLLTFWRLQNFSLTPNATANTPFLEFLIKLMSEVTELPIDP